MQGPIDVRLPCLEAVIVAEPVEIRRPHGVDQVIRCPWIELVIARDDIHRRQRIHEIEGIDDLHAVPQLALEGGIQEIAAVQEANVATLRL